MEIEKCLLLTILQIFPHCWEWLCKKGQKNSWHKHNIGQIVYYCSNTHLSEGQQQKNVSSLSYQFNCCCIWFSRRFLKVTVYFWELRSENKHCNASSPDRLSSNFEEEENAEFLPKVDHSVSWTKMMFTSKNPCLFVEKTLQKSIAKGYTWSNGQNGTLMMFFKTTSF